MKIREVTAVCNGCMQHISSSYLAAQQQINKQISNGNLNVTVFWWQTFISHYEAKNDSWHIK